MSDSLILYIGKPENGQTFAAAAEARGSYAYLPESLMDALGIYICYFPNIVVIDMAADYAQAAYDHLRSVDAKPIVLLTEERVRLASVYTLPSGASADAVLDTLDRIHEPQTVLNGILRYA